MPEGYRHLTFDGRCRIYATGKGVLSDGAIAGRPGGRAAHHPATISREIRRNGGGRGYRQGQAWRKATGRRSGASSVPGKLTEERRAKVVAKPGRAGARNRSRDVSGWRTPSWSAVSGYTTSYARTAGTEERLAGTCGGGERNRTGRVAATRAGGHVPGRRDIPERPKEGGAKAATGDREADTVIGGGHGGAVVSPVDGCPEFTPVRRVDGKRAEAVGGAMTDLPEGLGARVHTITADNGKEFAGHAKVAKALEADFLLPTPHHPWERGLNGHTDGPPPRYLPKGTDLRQVTDARVKRVQDILNARPRKAPGHLTPAEAFARARPP